jgi:hypothetical protein
MLSDDIVKILCIAPTLTRTETLARNLTGSIDTLCTTFIGNAICAIISEIDNYDCELIEVNNADELIALKTYLNSSYGVFVISPQDYSERIGIDYKWIKSDISYDGIRKIIKDSIKSLKQVIKEAFEKLSIDGVIDKTSLGNFLTLTGENLTEREIALCLSRMAKNKEKINYDDFERWFRKNRENCSLLKRIVYLAIMNSRSITDISLKHEIEEFRNKEINIIKSSVKIYSHKLKNYKLKIIGHVVKDKDKISLLRMNRPDNTSLNNYLEIDFKFVPEYNLDTAIEWLKGTTDYFLRLFQGSFGVIAGVYDHFFTTEFHKRENHTVCMVIKDKLESNSLLEDLLSNVSGITDLIPEQKDLLFKLKSDKTISNVLCSKLFDAFANFNLKIKSFLLKASAKQMLKQYKRKYKDQMPLIDLFTTHQFLRLKLQTKIENLFDKQHNYDLSELMNNFGHEIYHDNFESLEAVKVHIRALDLYAIVDITGFK